MMLGYAIQAWRRIDVRGVQQIKLRRLDNGKTWQRVVREDEPISDQFDRAAESVVADIDEKHRVIGRALGAEGQRFYFASYPSEMRAQDVLDALRDYCECADGACPVCDGMCARPAVTWVDVNGKRDQLAYCDGCAEHVRGGTE